MFWPYVYSDIFYYPFWPDAYAPGYWAYVYDDFVDTVFWGPEPEVIYAYAPELGGRSTSRTSRQVREQRRTVQQLCNAPGSGVTAWPFERMERSLNLDADQRQLLADLKQAAADAEKAFKASCPEDIALTPPARVDAMIRRIDATLEAVRTVRPPLERFYNALTDEQKARFNAIGPAKIGERREPAQDEQQAMAESCREPKTGLTQIPLEAIEQTVRPTEAQRAAFDRLREAAEQAVATLQAECPTAVPLTPVGRLETMQARLEALSKAAHTVQQPLQEFYAALDNEQKAAFNALRPETER